MLSSLFLPGPDSGPFNALLFHVSISNLIRIHKIILEGHNSINPSLYVLKYISAVFIIALVGQGSKDDDGCLMSYYSSRYTLRGMLTSLKSICVAGTRVRLSCVFS
jgi:hypothetical protein